MLIIFSLQLIQFASLLFIGFDYVLIYGFIIFFFNFQLHSGSNSLLSKLIHQSYHGTMDTVALNGTVPVKMLLEIGLDKLKKDYISFFIGESLSQLKKLKCTSQSSVIGILRCSLSTWPQSFTALALPLVPCEISTSVLWLLVSFLIMIFD